MKKVYVLGAGFSFQGGIPTLANFFEKVNEKKNKTDNNKNDKTEIDTFETILHLKEYGNNMETAFSKISSEFDLNEFNKKIKSEYNKKDHLINDFLYTVCRTFHLCWTDGGRDYRCLYRRFLENIINENATLITFNYDLILDNLLFDMKLIPYYGFELDSANTINYDSNYPQLKESGITFLKLHGSQKWFICKSCNNEFTKIDFDDTWPSGRGDKEFSCDEGCPSCKKKTMNYLIIPPLKGKNSSPVEKLLKANWKVAESKLRDAQEIIFIGYSFPESDTNIRDQFTKWLKGNIVLESIKVVDPNANDGNFRSRFNHIFERKWAPTEIHQFPQVPKCTLTYTPKTFLCWLLEDVIKL